ncbi:MAG: hypothetical protein ACI8Q1_002694, partial [Parvicella sp.]
MKKLNPKVLTQFVTNRYTYNLIKLVLDHHQRFKSRNAQNFS